MTDDPANWGATDEEHNATLRRAYSDLLGESYQRDLHSHIMLTSVVQACASDFDSALTYLERLCEEAVATMPPCSFSAALVTDEGSALLGMEMYEVRDGRGILPRMSDFAAALKVSYLAVAYSSGSPRAETFSVTGTDGAVARTSLLTVTRKGLGGHKTTTVPWQREEQTAPEEDNFLNAVARRIRPML